MSGDEELDFSVVIPAYNEGGAIGAVLSQLKDELDAMERMYEILVVSDGSTDQTAAFTNFRFKIPHFGELTGAFQITSLEYAGEHNGEVTYSMSFESAGYITYAAL